MGGRRLPLILTLSIALVLAACGSGEDLATPTATLAPAEPTPVAEAAEDATEQPDAEPTAAPEDAPTEAAEPVDEDAAAYLAVPDEIDVAYVESVLRVLDAMLADMMAEIAQSQQVTDAAGQIADARYGQDEADFWLSIWSQVPAEDLARLRPEPDPPVAAVTDLLEVRQDCIVAAVDRNLDGLWDPEFEHNMNQPGWHIELRRLPEGQVGSGLNPTPWEVAYDRTNEVPTCG